MFKKYFFFLIFLGLSFSFLGSTHVHAFIDKSPAPVEWQQNATYTAEVVSQNDFHDTINIQVLSAPINAGKTAQLSINWNNPGEYSQPFKTVTLDANGDATVTIPNHLWIAPAWPVGATNNTYEVDVKAEVAGYYGTSDGASYKVKASYAETSLTNKQGYANNATIPLGTQVVFDCQNSSEMYFGSADNWGAAQLVDHDYGSQTSGNGGGLKTPVGYSLESTTTFNTPGNYRVECDNLGGTASRNVFTLTVAPAPVMTGALSASPAACLISAGANSCSTNLTWTTTNPVGTSQVTAAGMTSLTGNNGTNVSATVPYGGRTFYLYNNAQPLDEQAVSASCTSGTTWDGSECATNKTYFDITNMASSPNQVATNNTITWTSSAQICNVYNSSKTTKIGTGTQSGSSYSSTIPAAYVNSSPGPQTYEIKCYDPTAYPASDLTADTDPHTGWQAYPANLGAPTCATGTSWNGTACVAPSGNLSASPTTCTIAIGASTCSTKLTWTTANAIGTAAVTSNTPSANTTVATGNSGTNVSATVYYSSRTFYLYDNGNQLGSPAIVNAVCAAGSTWNGSSCAANPNPTGNISANPTTCTIAIGASTCSTKLTWTTANAIGTAAYCGLSLRPGCFRLLFP